MDGSGSVNYTEFIAGAIEKDKLICDKKLRRAFEYFDSD
jgi:hypothetical protein